MIYTPAVTRKCHLWNVYGYLFVKADFTCAHPPFQKMCV